MVSEYCLLVAMWPSITFTSSGPALYQQDHTIFPLRKENHLGDRFPTLLSLSVDWAETVAAGIPYKQAYLKLPAFANSNSWAKALATTMSHSAFLCAFRSDVKELRLSLALHWEGSLPASLALDSSPHTSFHKAVVMLSPISVGLAQCPIVP